MAEINRNLWDRAANTWRRLVDTATVAWDTSTPGQAKANVPDSGVTYAKMQDISATQRVLGRNSAGAGVVEEVTLSQLLDWIGSAAQGDILYRGASSWARLSAGTSGQFLQTQGAGANPQWAAPSGWQLIAQNTAPGTVSQVNFDQAAIAQMTELLLVWEAVTVTASLTVRIAVSTDGGTTFANISYQKLQNQTGSENRQQYIDPTDAEANAKQGHCHIFNLPAGFKPIVAHGSRAGGSNFQGLARGTVEDTGTINYVRLLTSTSTITGGNIRLYGRA
jgi:hypothetical protein